MQFDNGYYLSDQLEQLKPQQLDSNIFFGPLNILTQLDFIKEQNIRFFIGIGLDTQRLATLLYGNQIFYNNKDDILMVNFDSSFNRDNVMTDSVSHMTKQYYSHNTSLLNRLIGRVLHGNLDSNPSLNTHRCLTPTPERPDVSQLLHGDISHYYNSGNIYTESDIEKFNAFNDLITIFKSFEAGGNILVFSQNGNDEDIVTLLISTVLKKNPFVKIPEAFQFIKSLRPTIHDLQQEHIYWCRGLIDFSEAVRSKNMHGGVNSQSGSGMISPSPKHFRKRADSIEECDRMKKASLRILGECKRTRIDQ